VQVEAGEYSKRVMSRAYVSAEEEAAGIVLACRVKPLSDLRLAVLGKMKKNVCATPSAAAADAGGSKNRAGAPRRMRTRGARVARGARNPVRDP